MQIKPVRHMLEPTPDQHCSIVDAACIQHETCSLSCMLPHCCKYGQALGRANEAQSARHPWVLKSLYLNVQQTPSLSLLAQAAWWLKPLLVSSSTSVHIIIHPHPSARMQPVLSPDAGSCGGCGVLICPCKAPLQVHKQVLERLGPSTVPPKGEPDGQVPHLVPIDGKGQVKGCAAPSLPVPSTGRGCKALHTAWPAFSSCQGQDQGHMHTWQ